MKTFSSEERDQRLKSHLIASGELYPALISPESEYKVLQKIVAGILSVVLRPRESQCPLVQTICRELLTCLVVRPLVSFASPEFINEKITQVSINLRKVNEQKTPSIEDESHPEQDSGDWARMPEVMPPNVIELIFDLADIMFQLNRGGWFRRQSFETSKRALVLVMGDVVDDCFLKKICWLRNEDTVANGIRWVQDILWPNGVDDGEEALNQTDPSEETFQLGGKKVVEPISFEQQFEEVASDIKTFFLNEAPTALVGFVWQNLHRTCAQDIFYFTQSNICIKQLAFAILELLLLAVFPELKALVRDNRENPPHGRSE